MKTQTNGSRTELRVSLCSMACLVTWICFVPAVQAQVNSGSDGHDGAFNPTATNTIINMADHPDGIYQYTEVNIPTNVTVTFIPNAANTPVVWLVQSNCVISGTVDVSGQNASGAGGSAGGPGGFRGGNGGSSATAGQGPGGGAPWTNSPSGCGGLNVIGGNASFGTVGGYGGYNCQPGALYGNVFLLPLLGGSGGGGGCGGGVGSGGAGGGGAILIAASLSIQIDGSIIASGGSSSTGSGGAGSGGAIRLVTRSLLGCGQVTCAGGQFLLPGWPHTSAGSGRIRLDYIESLFGGNLAGTVTQGFQPIIIPAAGQGIQLAIASVGGVAVPGNPSGVPVPPDVTIPGQQVNPITIVVHCSNLPLNTPITVTVRPANGSSVSAVGNNSTGTPTSSTATVSLNMPRGGGILYATAATGN